MPQRKYSKEQRKVTKVNPRVILPISYEEYAQKSEDGETFRQWVDEMIEEYPELFPQEIEGGYVLHDKLPESVKLTGVCFRRIKLKRANENGQQQVLTIGTSDVMP
jgi:hypothetical protein